MTMISTTELAQFKRSTSDPIQIPARGRKLRVEDQESRPMSPELLFEMSPPTSEFAAMRIPFAPSNSQNMAPPMDEPQPLYSFPSFSALSRRNSASGSPTPDLKPRGRGRRTSSSVRRPSLMRRPTGEGNTLVRTASMNKNGGFTPIVCPEPRPYRTRYPLYPMHTDCYSPPPPTSPTAVTSPTGVTSPASPTLTPSRSLAASPPWTSSPWYLPGRADSMPGDDAESTDGEPFVDFRDYLLACIENGRPLRSRRGAGGAW
ncbi:hypothetical protein GGF50DRAFT_127997 [Schizophyllum commune]